MQPYFRIFQKEEECNYFSTPPPLTCGLCCSCVILFRLFITVISLAFLFLTLFTPSSDAYWARTDGELPAFLKCFTL